MKIKKITGKAKLLFVILPFLLSLILSNNLAHAESNPFGPDNTLIMKKGSQLKSVTVSGIEGAIKQANTKSIAIETFDNRATEIYLPSDKITSDTKIEALYDNVGYIYGEPVKLRLTLTSFKVPDAVHNRNYIWTKFGKKTTTNTFNTDQNSFTPTVVLSPDSYFGVYYLFLQRFEASYEYLDENNEPVILSKDDRNQTLLTFDSLNGVNDNIALHGANDHQVPDGVTGEWVNYAQGGKKYLVPDSNVVSYRSPMNSNILVWGGKKGGTFIDKRDSPNFFLNSICYIATRSSKHTFATGSGLSSAWFTLSSLNFEKEEPLVTPREPEKTVDKPISKKGDKLNYSISQIIPNFSKKTDGIKFEDNVPEELTIDKVTVEGYNPEIKINNNKISFELKRADLKEYANMKIKVETTINKLPLANSSQFYEIKNIANFSITQNEKIIEKTTPPASTKIKQNKIKLIHYDLKKGKIEGVLKTEEFFSWNGDTIQVKNNNDLWKIPNKVKYQPIEKDYTLNVEEKDLTIYIPYETLNLNAKIKELTINTNKKNNNLDSTLSLEVTTSKNIDLFDKTIFKVSVTDTVNNNILWTRNLTSKELTKINNIKLNTKEFNYKQGEKILVGVNIELIENPDYIEFEKEKNKFDSFGFIASETVVKNELIKNKEINLTLPIQTIKSIDKQVQIKNENFFFQFNDYQKAKTGYGLTENYSVTYSNELKNIFNFNTEISFDSKLQEKNSLITYESIDKNKKKIQLKSTEKTSDNKQVLKFDYIDTLIEEKTGTIVENNDLGKKKISNNYIAGGSKFYIPIWLDLGKYEMNYAFKEGSTGNNYITLDLKKTIDIYSYMYSHKDSKTTKNDELLLVPIFRN